MTTLDIIDLIIAALLGAAICFCFCMAVHRQHKKAWRLEYRRLMDGIDAAMEQNIADDPDGDNPNKTYYILSELLYGD